MARSMTPCSASSERTSRRPRSSSSAWPPRSSSGSAASTPSWASIRCDRRLSGDPMIVDVHAHYFPRPYIETLMRIGGRSLPEAARPLTPRPMMQDDPSALDKRMAQMDDAGVSLQVLSPAASPPYAEKEADAVAAARLLNDSYAELATKYPGRLAAFVSLPLPHIDASLREMELGLDRLGMLGVSMTCSCFDRSTAEAEFEPLYAEMNRRRAVLNYHPI